jgi:DNA-binding response OmpR family regulator
LTIFVSDEGHVAQDGAQDEMRLLLVEDSSRLRELLTEAVHEAGWRIDAVGALQDAETAVAVAPYDLFLVDLGLPDGDGLDLIRALRRSGVKTPVLVLTARGAIDERIAGLDAGADDYLVKPFNTGELLARCRALLRRSPNSATPTLTAGKISLDVASGVGACEDADLGLAPRERMVLEILMRDAGRVVQKRKLEHALSEFGDEMSSNAVELAISRLRKKLEPHDCGVSLETIRGVGYMLREAQR